MVALAEFPAAARRCHSSGGMIAKLFSKKKLDLGSMVSIRHRPQVAYLSPSWWLGGVRSLRILMRSTRFSIPKSVKAITPSSPKP